MGEFLWKLLSAAVAAYDSTVFRCSAYGFHSLCQVLLLLGVRPLALGFERDGGMASASHK